uniref:Phosphorylase b kinase regulatory subunit n=1 Tax=Gongylonema pulchrum TaxID=637853 RepID=A0A183F1N5_9BILA
LRYLTGEVQYKLPVYFTSHQRIIATNVKPQPEYRIWGLTACILHIALLNLFPKFYKSEIEIAIPN